MSAVVINILKVLFLAAMYGFVWLVARSIRGHLREASTSESREVAPAPPIPQDDDRLLTVSVRDSGGAERSLDVRAGAVIGRSPDSGIQIDDPYASDSHLRFGADDDGVWVEDLGSTNGTSVNGVRIDGRVRITPDDTVVVGETIMVVR